MLFASAVVQVAEPFLRSLFHELVLRLPQPLLPDRDVVVVGMDPDRQDTELLDLLCRRLRAPLVAALTEPA
jgi:hypothetical protein